MNLSFFPPKKDFLGVLSGQAAKVEEGMAQLVKYLNNPSEKNAEGVKKIEKEADELRRLLIEELNRTFVTPIDGGIYFRDICLDSAGFKPQDLDKPKTT